MRVINTSESTLHKLEATYLNVLDQWLIVTYFIDIHAQIRSSNIVWMTSCVIGKVSHTRFGVKTPWWRLIGKYKVFNIKQEVWFGISRNERCIVALEFDQTLPIAERDVVRRYIVEVIKLDINTISRL